MEGFFCEFVAFLIHRKKAYESRHPKGVKGEIMATQKKIETVQEMTDNIKKAKSIVFVDYVGLKHKQLEDLRKKLRVVGAEFMVTKNKLLERAFGTKADSVKPLLKNATGTLFNPSHRSGCHTIIQNPAKTTTLGTISWSTHGTNSRASSCPILEHEQTCLGINEYKRSKK